jgi:hypothetical protein
VACFDRAVVHVVSVAARKIHELAERRPRLPAKALVSLEVGSWRGAGIEARLALARYGERQSPQLVLVFRDPKRSSLPVTVRVRISGDPALAPRADRRWLRGARRSSRRRARGATEYWFVEPARTPERLTAVVILFYLCRAGFVDTPVPGSATWDLAASITKRPWLEIGKLWEIHKKVRDRFTMPEDWRAFRKYLSRVTSTVMGTTKCFQKEAQELGIGRATYYRWRKDGLDQQAIQKRAVNKGYRRAVMTVLTGDGGTKEASRKAVQRWLKRGRPLESLAEVLSQPEKGRGRKPAALFAKREKRAGINQRRRERYTGQKVQGL